MGFQSSVSMLALFDLGMSGRVIACKEMTLGMQARCKRPALESQSKESSVGPHQWLAVIGWIYSHHPSVHPSTSFTKPEVTLALSTLVNTDWVGVPRRQTEMALKEGAAAANALLCGHTVRDRVFVPRRGRR